MSITSIPLSSLIPSPVNVRKIGGTSIDDLAASIEAHGLIQTLTVRPAEKDKFEVVAGGRRLAALTRLMKEKLSANGVKVTKAFTVDCRVLDGENATEISLAENAIRQGMHPADQFDAFKALADGGMGEADIAARFTVSEKIVKQRLKLARVSPKLIDLYRKDEMNLEQLEAFTLTDDQKKQEEVWKALEKQPSYNRGQYAIRQHLTEAKVSTGDRRVKVAGLETYEAAGGTITRDLFSTRDEGYIDDVALLDRLVAEKLEGIAEAVRAEGWDWVKIDPDDFSPYSAGMRVLPAAERGTLAPDVQERLTGLKAECEKLERQQEALEEAEEFDEAANDVLQEKIDTIDAQISEIEAMAGDVWPDETKALAGAVVSIGWQGLEVTRGLVARDDKPDAVASLSSPKTNPEKPDFSAALFSSLSAERTQAMQAAMIEQPEVALDALLHALTGSALYLTHVSSAVKTHVTTPALRTHAGAGIDATPAALALAEAERRWKSLLPDHPEALWQWLADQPTAQKLDLLAFLVARGIDAIVHHPTSKLPHADQLHTALGLDMADWWKPTGGNYLGRVPRDKVLEALVEAGETPENMVAFRAMKKAPLIEKAAKALAKTRWLPKPLRSPEPEVRTVANENTKMEEAA